ncbi:MAG: O-antigen ligase domain-containing protein [Planctomycetes bacterium]|nr:O-antigen ligase domain-containing protein [Planctomycetota bacterium]
MNASVSIALYGWLPLTLVLFQFFTPRRAVLISMIGGWLFLPIAGFHFEGLPDYSKSTVIGVVPLIAAILFDTSTVLNLRPRWIDIPILFVCCVPMASSLFNGLGPYDGMSAVLGSSMDLLVPWILGRMYFADLRGMRELAIAIMIGGLIYVPFCLFEVRMSPQLHYWVYGFHQSAPQMDHRLGGYRPKVFMQHGIALGLWMSIATSVCLVLWRSRAVKQVMGIPMSYAFWALLVTTVLCRASNAYTLLLLVFMVFYVLLRLRIRWVMVLVLISPMIYIADRMTTDVIAPEMIDIAEVFSQNRADSLGTRIDQENQQRDHIMQQIWFGWGGWNRNVVITTKGRWITDSLWIITISKNGWIATVMMWLVFCLPGILLARRLPLEYLVHPMFAPATALALTAMMVSFDSVFNAMIGPPYFVVCGALGGLVTTLRRPARRAVPARRASVQGRPVGQI